MYYLVQVGSQRYHGTGPLTYQSDDQLENGTIVRITLGRQPVLGFIAKKTTKPSFATKPIEQAWPSLCLPQPSQKLLVWMQQYYPGLSGQTTDLFLPANLTKTSDLIGVENKTTKTQAPPALTSDQAEAVSRIEENQDSSILLHGITGSGKTRIYIEVAKRSIANGSSVLILTPEIGLTEPLAKQFREYVPADVIVQHSGMTPAERRAVWISVATATRPIVVIGPRSAIFLPFDTLGLIVVDEAHDAAYKQSQAPRYNGLRVAGKLRELHGAQLIYGTATPLVNERYLFELKKLPIIELKNRAIQQTPTTQKATHVVDNRNRQNFTRSAHLSSSLLEAIQQALDNQEQSLLFLNKRGSARLILCNACGWQALCPRCDVSLTYHADSHNLRCHSCETVMPVPSSCPECANADIVFRSIGTKTLESELSRLFPHATVGRFDSDTDKANTLTARSQELHEGAIDIIIGTQTVTKGFDLPKLRVVGIVQADTSLGVPDFMSHERTYQLISQVSGRVGRGHRQGELFIQSFNPDHPVIQYAANDSYELFYADEIAERKQYHFPPFVQLLVLRCSRASREKAQAACEKLRDSLKQSHPSVQIDGPAPRFIEKQRGKYQWQLIVKSSRRSTLVDIASNLPGSWTYDLDPIDLL